MTHDHDDLNTRDLPARAGRRPDRGDARRHAKLKQNLLKLLRMDASAYR
jgi:hypothetical protein